MKVALCLSGHFRSFERTFPTLKSAILDQYQPDVFIHTWDTMGFDGNRGDGHLIRAAPNDQQLKGMYNPKKIIIEPNKQWDTSKYHIKENIGVRNPAIMLSMFYSICQANQLKSELEKELGFTYDVVIRCRPDIYFENFLPKHEMQNCFTNNSIYVPKFGNYNGINDQFAFGPSKIMDLYCDIYSNLDKFYDTGCLWHPETMLKFNIHHFNIPVLRSSVKYFLLRANGYIFRLECKKEYGDIE